MIKIVKLWILLLVLAAGVTLCAAPKRSSNVIPSDLTTTTLSLVGAPRIGHNQQGSEKTSYLRWLQVRVSYKFNPNFRYKPFFTYDDMRVEIYMRVTPSNGTWRGLRWFSGTQYLYKVIPDARSKEYHAVSFFMPPGLIHNFAKRSEKSLLKDCEGILFFYNGDRLLGRAFFCGAANTSRQVEKLAGKLLAEYKIMSSNPDLLVKDGLWPREMTPWRYLDADRFDLPRPEFPKAAPASASAPAAPEAAAATGNEKEKETENVGEKESEDSGMKFTRSSDGKKKKRRGRK